MTAQAGKVRLSILNVTNPTLMLHPLISTVIQRPDLVVDHASAYVALFQEEATHAGKELLEKAIAWAIAGVTGLLFVIFAGIAVMLGFVNQHFSWALVLVPGVFLAIAVAAFLKAQKPMKSNHFPELKAQMDSDAQALRMAA